MWFSCQSRLVAPWLAASSALLIATAGHAQTARIELHSFQSTTLTDEQFLNGIKEGRPVTIAGELRLPRPGSDRLPAIVLLHGSGGVNSSVADRWTQELLGIGIATFMVDSFTGRGLVNTNNVKTGGQAQLGRLVMIVDAYRALDLLARHPRIDPNRVAVMGFSRGGQSALYASLQRFQRMHASGGRQFAAHITFYADCSTTFREDDQSTGRPIRMHHGTADDYVPIAPCRTYVARLRAGGADVKLAEYPDAYHVFDNPGFKKPVKAANSETWRNCSMHEDEKGRILNNATRQPFTYKDSCVEFGPTIAYNAEAHAASVKAVKEFLAATFRLP